MIEQQHAETALPRRIWSLVDILFIIIGIGLIVVICLGLIIIASRFFPSLSLNEKNPSIYLTVGLTAVEAIAILGSIYFFGVLRHHYQWGVIGLIRLSPGWLISSIIIGIIAIPVSSLIALGVQLLLGESLNNPQLEFLVPEGFSWFGMIGMFLLAGILVPIAEELFFRGVLFRWFRQKMRFIFSALIIALIFGILHGEISVAVSAFFLGMVLAWVFEKSGSLWSSIIIHIINNSFKILLLYILIAVGVQL